MGCTRKLLRIWDKYELCAVLVFLLLSPAPVWAAFASQFSFSIGERYSDNIFFSKDREHDFVTVFTPTLTLHYAPEGPTVPTLNLNISPSGQIYARHSELNNFGDNISVNGGYTFQYSPRLHFHLSDTFQHQGRTRTEGMAGPAEFRTGPTSPPAVGEVTSLPLSQNLRDLVSRGDQLTNSLSFRGSYLFRPNMSFTGAYTNTLTHFVTAGGTDVFHAIHARGIYNWRQDHNLHAGYSIAIGNARNGDRGVIHNFDVGDDYFSNYTLQLTPTLSLAASTGLSFNAGSSGPRVANNTSITITKLWETAQLNGGLRKGLTPSFGVSGISDTTSLFANFNFRVTEKITTRANANFAFFDTKDVNFKTFQAGLGLHYLITSWLSSDFTYRFNWIDSGAGSSATDLLSRGSIRSNGVSFSLTTRFDLWPNVGLARAITSPTLTPILQPPFPRTPPPQPGTPSPLTIP